jgi:hypothetical protein
MSNKNRDKGHRFERQWATKFRDELGFKFCKTSRQASRMLDDSGVDLDGIPFNVQLKNGYARGINYTNLFEGIDVKLAENYMSSDPRHIFPSVVIHKLGRKQSQHQVIMKADDWVKLVKMAFINKDK